MSIPRTPLSIPRPAATPLSRGLSALVVLVALGVAPAASAHDGTAADLIFKGPVGLVQAKGTVEITWEDGDFEPDADHALYFQPLSIPPTHVPAGDQLKGTLLHEVSLGDLANTFTWDVSAVPTGVYRVYAVTTQPDICQHVAVLPAVIAVHQEADPAPTGVMVVSPLETNVISDGVAEIVFEAVSPTAPTLTLTAGQMVLAAPEDEPLCDPFRQRWEEKGEIANEVVMTADPEAGPDRWRATVAWDTSTLEKGFYALYAELATASGPTGFAWSHRWVATSLSVARAEMPTASDAASGDVTRGSDAASPQPEEDGFTVPESPTAASGCAGGDPADTSAWWLLLFCVAAWGRVSRCSPRWG